MQLLVIVRTCAFPILFIVLLASSVQAQIQCDTILTGLVDQRVTTTKTEFANSYLKWLNSNEFNSESSFKTRSATLGVTVPVKGIPVNFAGSYQRGDYGSKSWSKAFSEYLQTSASGREQFFQSVLTANKDVIEAWTECKKLQAETIGLYCSAVQTDDPDEIELIVDFKPAPGDSIVTIEDIEYPEDKIEPIANYLGKEIASNGRVLTFRRKNLKSGRIQLFTNSVAYRCTKGETGRFVALVREPVTVPVPPPKMNFISGNYGDPKRCWDGVSGTNLGTLRAHCTGNSKCTIEIDDNVLGYDPNRDCARKNGQRPYLLEAHYKCGNGPVENFRCNEGTTMHLQCPGNGSFCQ